MGTHALGRAVDDALPDAAEHGLDRLAPLVDGAGDLHHRVGGEQLDHLVEAPAVGVRVVPRDQVTDGFPRDELFEIHAVQERSSGTALPLRTRRLIK